MNGGGHGLSCPMNISSVRSKPLSCPWLCPRMPAPTPWCWQHLLRPGYTSWALFSACQAPSGLLLTRGPCLSTSADPASGPQLLPPCVFAIALPSAWKPLSLENVYSCKIKPFGETFPGFSGGSFGGPPALAHNTHFCRNKVGGLPGAWARLVAALLLLAVSCSLAVRQLQGRGSPAGGMGSGAPPVSRHAHHAGEFHHSAIISPAGGFWRGQGLRLMAPGPAL